MKTTFHHRHRAPLAAALLALALPASAAAVHWPHFGGDAGRSGNQPVGEGTPPVRALYSKAEAADQNVQTSIVATAGDAAAQRFAYGTAAGNVHLRMLESGVPLGPAGGVDVDDAAADADILGAPAAAPAPASVGLVDTSGPSGPGQLLAVHNDDDQSDTGDIAIAQIDEQNGTLVKQVALEGTDGFSISSSALLTAAGASGDRVLFFVAENDDDERLFRVPIANASAAAASFGAVTSTADVDADPQASPALVWLRDAAGQPKAHVAIGAGAPDANVKTFAVDDLAAGPASGDLGDAAQTPTVPVQADGTPPSPAGPAKTAPALFVAARAGATTVVHRLVQNGNAQALATAHSSPALQGAPAPALATDVEATGTGHTGGRVVVTTGQNLYMLDGQTLALASTFSPAVLVPGTSGFGQTTAAVANGLAYVASDDGRQLVLKLADAQPVEAAEFTENPVNGGARPAKSGFGQPSLSRSFVQFASAKGVFVYVSRCGNPITGSAGPDKISDGPAGSEIVALDGNDTVSAGGGDDCVFGGLGDDALSGNDGDDRVSAQAGSDRVYGRAGDDAISGNGDSDRVVGGLGADRAFGRTGDDRVVGGTGDDLVLGGADDDGVSGSAGNDVVRGNTGDDRLFGRAGDDRMSGNSGSDRILPGAGADRVFGRAGDDRIFARDGEVDVVFCGSGRDTVFADRGDVLRGCERALGR